MTRRVGTGSRTESNTGAEPGAERERTACICGFERPVLEALYTVLCVLRSKLGYLYEVRLTEKVTRQVSRGKLSRLVGQLLVDNKGDVQKENAEPAHV